MLFKRVYSNDFKEGVWPKSSAEAKFFKANKKLLLGKIGCELRERERERARARGSVFVSVRAKEKERQDTDSCVNLHLAVKFKYHSDENCRRVQT